MKFKYSKLQVLFFLWAGREFGMELKDVREILKLEKTQPVPLAPSFLNRIMNARGRVLSIFYLNQFFKINAGPDAAEARVMVLGDNEVQAGIYADSVSRIEFMEPSCLNPDPGQALQKNVKGFVKGALEIKTCEKKILLLDSGAVIKFLKKIKFRQKS
ncbi:MAG: chemotaxis protein CheW [Nitrospinae bacterium]|nr:chemotaxis protein CheW [Nitrospinota bacterium]